MLKKAIIYTIIGILLLIFVVIPLLKFVLGYVVALTSLSVGLITLLLPVIIIALVVKVIFFRGKKK